MLQTVTVHDGEGGTTIEQYSIDALAYLAKYRREKEIDPVSIGSGDTLVTITPNLRTVFTIDKIKRDGIGVNNYRANNGVFNLTAAQIVSLDTAINNHIAKCFSAQATVEQAHASTPYTSISAIETAFNNAYNS